LVTSEDPRARILLIVFATTIVASTPRGELLPFAAYFPLCAILILTHRVSLSYVAWRCAAASLFVLFAAGLLFVQVGFSPEASQDRNAVALSVVFKGYAAVLLLASLTGSTSLAQLLSGLRRLRSPEALNSILSMMYRYTSLLSEEYSRMERARDSRTVRPLGSRRFKVYGHQLGTLILRSWDRAERIHAAMLSRGFDGTWPVRSQQSVAGLNLPFLLLTGTAFLAARIAL
jgi:cobalt/nickel transport system permease protein